MNSYRHFASIINSTLVRFIVALLVLSVVLTSNVMAAPKGGHKLETHASEAHFVLADAQRDQLQVRQLRQWNALLLMGLDDCQRALHIDVSLAHSMPDQYTLAAGVGADSELMRADFVRQQMYCRVQNNSAMHQQMENKLRHLCPNLPLLAPVGAGTVSESYAQALAAILALQWLSEHAEISAMATAQKNWRQSPLAALYAPVWQLRLHPNAQLQGMLATTLNVGRSIANQDVTR